MTQTIHPFTIHTFIKDGFVIRFAVFPETDHPDNQFDDNGETARRINAGEHEWFVAMVTASKNGVELAREYLGGFCYETSDAFMEPGGYFDIMVDEAISAARQTISDLAA